MVNLTLKKEIGVIVSQNSSLINISIKDGNNVIISQNGYISQGWQASLKLLTDLWIIKNAK